MGLGDSAGVSQVGIPRCVLTFIPEPSRCFCGLQFVRFAAFGGQPALVRWRGCWGDVLSLRRLSLGFSCGWGKGVLEDVSVCRLGEGRRAS